MPELLILMVDRDGGNVLPEHPACHKDLRDWLSLTGPTSHLYWFLADRHTRKCH